jgi:hypothetical protein
VLQRPDFKLSSKFLISILINILFAGEQRNSKAEQEEVGSGQSAV